MCVVAQRVLYFTLLLVVFLDLTLKLFWQKYLLNACC